MLTSSSPYVLSVWRMGRQVPQEARDEVAIRSAGAEGAEPSLYVYVYIIVDTFYYCRPKGNFPAATGVCVSDTT